MSPAPPGSFVSEDRFAGLRAAAARSGRASSPGSPSGRGQARDDGEVAVAGERRLRLARALQQVERDRRLRGEEAEQLHLLRA